MTDLTPEQLTELEKLEATPHSGELVTLTLDSASWAQIRALVDVAPRLIAMARKVRELEAYGETRWQGALRQITAQAREIAGLKADLSHSEYLRSVAESERDGIIVGFTLQTQEIAELKAVEQSSGELRRALDAALADQAQRLAEARRLIDVFIRCDMACVLEGSHCTDPSGHWPDCSLHQARALLAKLPIVEPEE